MRIEIILIKEQSCIKLYKDDVFVLNIPVKQENIKEIKQDFEEKIHKLINNYFQ
jgi:hypothetical protein